MGEEIDVLLERARHYVNLGRYTEAESTLGEVFAQDPEDSAALALAVRLLWNTDRGDEAVRTAESLIAEHPDEPFGYYALAFIRYRQDDPRAAEIMAREAVEREPDGVEERRLLATVIAEIPGRAAEAQEIMLDAIALDPEDPDSYEDLSWMYCSLQEWQQAEDTIRHALALEPDNTRYLARWGLILVQLGRYAEARDALNEAIADGPYQYELDQLAHVIEYNGIPEELRGIYRAVHLTYGRPDLSEPGAAGGNPEWLQRQAEAAEYLCMGLHERPDEDKPRVLSLASALADAVLQADPTVQTARYAKGMLARAQERASDALSTLIPLVEEGFDGPGVFQTLLWSLDELESSDGLGWAARGVDRHHEDAEIWWYLGNFSAKAGDGEQTMAAAKRVLQLNPEEPYLDYLIGRAHLLLGDAVSAAVSFHAAIEVDDNDGDSRVWLAQLARDEGDLEEARFYVRRALEVGLDCAAEKALAAQLAAELDVVPDAAG